MSYPGNIDVEESVDFASPVDFSTGGIKGKLNGLKRIIGLGDIRASFEKVLDDFKPDVVHLNNIHSYLSPVVGELAHKRGIRVVWTLHDYKLLCPSYLCRRPNGENCEECFHGHLQVINHRCQKGSLLQSVIADIEARVWNKKRIRKIADMFVTPSVFMRNKMMEAGFEPAKIMNICNFPDPLKIEDIKAKGVEGNRKDHFCYIGRLSDEKGTETMLKAAAESKVKLVVAGSGPLSDTMINKYGSCPNITFVGHLNAKEVTSLLLESKCSILPSECYENNPLGVIESLCAGTPVIGANIGGIPELIGHGDGVVFTSGNVEELTKVLSEFDKRAPFNNVEISARAIARFSEDVHYAKLMKAYGVE
jgi:glycosyltransferase involved in cell wall biosynthesis